MLRPFTNETTIHHFHSNKNHSKVAIQLKILLIILSWAFFFAQTHISFCILYVTCECVKLIVSHFQPSHIATVATIYIYKLCPKNLYIQSTSDFNYNAKIPCFPFFVFRVLIPPPPKRRTFKTKALVSS